MAHLSVSWGAELAIFGTIKGNNELDEITKVRREKDEEIFKG